MKTLLFAIMLLAAICASAQEVTIYRLSNRNTYPGKEVPAYIVSNFEKANPGTTVLAWEPVNATWRATYHANNRIVHVYYNETGNTYRSVLPVIQNNVPEAIITKAIDTHGSSVYGITAIRGSGDTQLYQLRLLENGNMRTIWIDEQGAEVTNVFKVKEAEKEKEML